MMTPITNPGGESLDYTFQPGAASDRTPSWLVILGHGVTGNKDRPVVVNLADALNAAGFDTLRFSFAGNGESEGDFRESTITKEVGDLGSVIDAVSTDDRKICYLGHSMGAAVGVLRASQDPRINALISLAGMVDTKTFAETEFGDVTPDQGVMWEEDSCPLSTAFITDLRETIATVAPEAKTVRVPWLLLHGTADDVVSPKNTELIQALRGAGADVIFVDGAGHSFSDPSHADVAARSVVRWVRQLPQSQTPR